MEIWHVYLLDWVSDSWDIRAGVEVMRKRILWKYSIKNLVGIGFTYMVKIQNQQYIVLLPEWGISAHTHWRMALTRGTWSESSGKNCGYMFLYVQLGRDQMSWHARVKMTWSAGTDVQWKFQTNSGLSCCSSGVPSQRICYRWLHSRVFWKFIWRSVIGLWLPRIVSLANFDKKAVLILVCMFLHGNPFGVYFSAYTWCWWNVFSCFLVVKFEFSGSLWSLSPFQDSWNVIWGSSTRPYQPKLANLTKTFP